MNLETKESERLDALGMMVTHYQRIDGAYQPADACGGDNDTVRMIVYRPADDRYDFAGWQPWASRPFASHGGRYTSFAAALAWLEWIDAQRLAA